ncbi:unnamed protein product, partial [Brassica oleracea]
FQSQKSIILIVIAFSELLITCKSDYTKRTQKELSTRIYKNSKSNDPNRRREHTGNSDYQVSLVIVSVIPREFKSSHCLRMRAQTIFVNAGKKRWDHTSKEIRNA